MIGIFFKVLWRTNSRISHKRFYGKSIILFLILNAQANAPHAELTIPTINICIFSSMLACLKEWLKVVLFVWTRLFESLIIFISFAKAVVSLSFMNLISPKLDARQKPTTVSKMIIPIKGTSPNECTCLSTSFEYSKEYLNFKF